MSQSRCATRNATSRRPLEPAITGGAQRPHDQLGNPSSAEGFRGGAFWAFISGAVVNPEDLRSGLSTLPWIASSQGAIALLHALLPSISNPDRRSGRSGSN